jgi:hypothetical protein
VERLEIVESLLGERVARTAVITELAVEVVQIREPGEAGRSACLVIGDMQLEDAISVRSAPLGTPVGGDYRSDWRSALGENMARRVDAQLERWAKRRPVADVAISRLAEPLWRVNWDGGRAWILPESTRCLATSGDRAEQRGVAPRTGDSLAIFLVPLAIAGALVLLGVIAGDGAEGGPVVAGVGLLIGPGVALWSALKARGEMMRGLARAYADEDGAAVRRPPEP